MWHSHTHTHTHSLGWQGLIKNNSEAIFASFPSTPSFSLPFPRWQRKMGTSRADTAPTGIHQGWFHSAGRQSRQDTGSGIDWPRRCTSHCFGTGWRRTHWCPCHSAALGNKALFSYTFHILRHPNRRRLNTTSHHPHPHTLITGVCVGFSKCSSLCVQRLKITLYHSSTFTHSLSNLTIFPVSLIWMARSSRTPFNLWEAESEGI